MMKLRKEFTLLVLLVLFVCVDFVKAVTVPLIDLRTGRDSGWEIVISPSVIDIGEISTPYVYGVTDDAVYIQLDKTFTEPPVDMLFDPLIIEFEKTSADASLNIVIEDEYIVNDTGTEWFDFHMHLIVDILSPEAGFNPSFLPDGGQLEDVYFSTNSGYEGLPIELHFVDSDGSGVPSSPAGDDVFQPGYKSGQIVIATNPELEVGERFGLKEVPTVPEPATVCLLGIGGVLMAFRRKKRVFTASK